MREKHATKGPKPGLKPLQQDKASEHVMSALPTELMGAT